MSSSLSEHATLHFEIDNKDEYAQFFLSTTREITFYLNLLIKRASLVTAYFDEGSQFFLTSIVAIDEAKDEILIDPAQAETSKAATLAARKITLVANLDRVKIQFRIDRLHESQFEGRPALSANIPNSMLRLQRREFFRLEPPLASPISCQIAIERPSGGLQTLDPRVADISGGGISLSAPTSVAEASQPGMLFKDCRLDIPGEGVLLVNLRVKKAIEISANSGIHHLRIGCEFVGLPGTRLAMIERYITRIERERKARDSGLAD